MTFSDRRSACSKALDAAGVEALLVSNLTNVRYLTGMVSSAAKLAISRDGSAVLLTDGRYAEQARLAADDSPDLDFFIGDGEAQNREIERLALDLGSLGLEAEHISWSAQRAMLALFASGCELIPTSGLVERLRLVKDAAEVEAIQRAAAITDQALGAVVDLLVERPTERLFRAALDAAIIDAGADDLSFETIVASGPNSARAHHSAGTRRIEPGDLVVVDCGALVDGYHSDMTRTFSVGRPGAEAAQILELAAAAHAAGIDAVKPGATGDDVDRAARAVIEAAGRGSEFVHGVGHGVGLDIHEAPFMRGSDLPLVEGQVVTVEPGVYRSGVGGARVEDTVVVTEGGCRPLTSFPNNPIVG